MRTKFHKYGGLRRWFSLRCLMIHPVIGTHKTSLLDIKAAEEGVGLVNALDYMVIPLKMEGELYDSDKPNRKKALGLKTLGETRVGERIRGYFGIEGIHRGGGWVELSMTSSEEEDEDDLNEWTDEVWRNQVACDSIVRLKKVYPNRFFGSGKIIEIGEMIKKTSPDLVFINYLKMNNIQKKHLSKEWLLENGNSIKILDRFELILQIFAARAKSNLAKYELGLAYLHYAKSVVGKEGGIPVAYLANLRNFDISSLEEKTSSVSGRQSAGRGALGGEGEKEQQLLMDQVKTIEVKLKGLINKEREKQNNRFQDAMEVRDFRVDPRIAVIGYTNVGKSALLNALTNKDHVESQNRLFETLRTTSKSFQIATNLKGVIIDTIGFIDDLPTELIDSFGSTLKETESADVVILMEDVSHPLMDRQRKVAQSLLNKLGMEHLLEPSRLIRVWNKTDCVTQDRLDKLLALEENTKNIVMTSIKNGEGIDQIKEMVKDKVDILFKREPRTMKYLYSEHNLRFKWLNDNAGISNPGEIKVNERPGGDAILEYTVELSEYCYQKYLRTFSGDSAEKKGRKRDQVPEGWLS